MKKIAAVIMGIFMAWGIILSQADQSITPVSWKIPANLLIPINETVLPRISANELEDSDYADAENGRVPKVSRDILTDLGLENSGSWSTLQNGDRVWRLQISSAGAQALVPLFNRLYLPSGATLHFYMPDKEEILGAFTHKNTPVTRPFCPGYVHGENCIIEYFEPALQRGKGILHLDKVGYAYQGIPPLQKDLRSGSGSCEVNVVCPEGDNYRDQIRSVVMIFIEDEMSGAWCSGALVNNVRQDCTPYILTANHCQDGGVTDSLYLLWDFYFNYQADSCEGTNGPQTQIIEGCYKMASSDDNGGTTGSDFLLLQMDEIPPSDFNVFYTGWNITSTPPGAGVAIHHPQADIKKISTFTTPAIASNITNSPAQNTDWQVKWSPTIDGYGVTEPGSSGCPLIDSMGYDVGHLSTGGSCCTVGGCDGGGSPGNPDYFGQIAYDWTLDGAVDSVQLKPWLDPDNTGATFLAGINPPCGSNLQDDAGIQAIDVPTGTICDPDFTPTVVLRNFGGNVLNSVIINYSFDGGSLTQFSWGGDLQAGGSIAVQLLAVNLAQGSHSFLCFTTEPNDTTDSSPSNDTMSSNFYATNEGGSIVLNLFTDDQGSKITWQLTDVNNNVVASGGPYANYMGGFTYNIALCLPVACYTFTIFSADDSGMITGVDGNFTITNASGRQVYASLTNPDFGSQEVHHFCLTASGIQTVSNPAVRIIPNPSTDVFNLTFDNNEERNIRVFDVIGRLVLSAQERAANFELNLSNQSKGVYLLQVEGIEGKAIQKLVLK